jgi:uncharacterized protein YjbJ (UPF0337 family)
MVQAEALQANWNKVRGRIKKRWGQLSGDDLDRFEGDVDALVGEIQLKTGESRQVVEDYLEHFSSEAASAVGRAGEAAKQYAFRTASAVAAAPNRLAEGARCSYEGTQQVVQQRPFESLAVAFVTGLLAGVAIGLTLRSR